MIRTGCRPPFPARRVLSHDQSHLSFLSLLAQISDPYHWRMCWNPPLRPIVAQRLALSRKGCTRRHALAESNLSIHLPIVIERSEANSWGVTFHFRFFFDPSTRLYGFWILSLTNAQITWILATSLRPNEKKCSLANEGTFMWSRLTQHYMQMTRVYFCSGRESICWARKVTRLVYFLSTEKVVDRKKVIKTATESNLELGRGQIVCIHFLLTPFQFSSNNVLHVYVHAARGPTFIFGARTSLSFCRRASSDFTSR